MKLEARFVEKPWGRTDLPAAFAGPAGKRIGEIWLTDGKDLPLLAKYLFTSERLSVQVHPDDEQAKRRGFARGKAECWYVVDAEPGARIGLGLCDEVDEEQLRQAALDGSIVDLIRWWPVSGGDFIYVEPGAIHAIGGGLSLLEIQQNSDVTFRLFDYGRPRELHLDNAIAVADRRPYPEQRFQQVDPAKDCTLVDGPIFTVVHAHSDSLQDRKRWALPLEGSISMRDQVAHPGECLLLEPGDCLGVRSARLLLAAPSGA